MLITFSSPDAIDSQKSGNVLGHVFMNMGVLTHEKYLRIFKKEKC